MAFLGRQIMALIFALLAAFGQVPLAIVLDLWLPAWVMTAAFCLVWACFAVAPTWRQTRARGCIVAGASLARMPVWTRLPNVADRRKLAIALTPAFPLGSRRAA